jgi:hypothetical protein
MAAIPVDVSILEIKPSPVYQRIAPKARQWGELGMSVSEIAHQLGVDWKTVSRALRWFAAIGCRR